MSKVHRRETVPTTRPVIKLHSQTGETCSPLLPRTSAASYRGEFMGQRFGFLVIVVIALAGLLIPTPGASSAQSVPRSTDGKPDFSGLWSNPVTVNPTGPRGTGIFNKDKMAPVKPGAEGLLYHARTGDARQDEPRSACLPSGF